MSLFLASLLSLGRLTAGSTQNAAVKIDELVRNPHLKYVYNDMPVVVNLDEERLRNTRNLFIAGSIIDVFILERTATNFIDWKLFKALAEPSLIIKLEKAEEIAVNATRLHRNNITSLETQITAVAYEVFEEQKVLSAIETGLEAGDGAFSTTELLTQRAVLEDLNNQAANLVAQLEVAKDELVEQQKFYQAAIDKVEAEIQKFKNKFARQAVTKGAGRLIVWWSLIDLLVLAGSGTFKLIIDEDMPLESATSLLIENLVPESIKSDIKEVGNEILNEVIDEDIIQSMKTNMFQKYIESVSVDDIEIPLDGYTIGRGFGYAMPQTFVNNLFDVTTLVSLVLLTITLKYTISWMMSSLKGLFLPS